VELRRAKLAQLRQIELVHRQNQLETLEILYGDLASALLSQVDTALARGSARARVRRLTQVVGMSSRRINLDVQVGCSLLE
jgi:hypothetical protein